MISKFIGTMARTNLWLGATAALLLLTSAPGAMRAQAPDASSQASPFSGLGIFGQRAERGAGWLGLSISEVTADKAKERKLPAARGAVVDEVTAGSPAAKAGLKGGDVVTSYNGQPVEGVLEFERLVRETPPGRTAQIAVWRDGRSQTISAEVGSAGAAPGNAPPNTLPFSGPSGRFPGGTPPAFGPLPPGPSIPGAPGAPGQGAPGDGFRSRGAGEAPVLGVSAQDLTGQLGSYFGVPDGEGVLINNVRENSAGAKAGLMAGDVITKVDGQHVRNLAELRQQLRAKRDAKSVALTVVRKGAEISLSVQPEAPQSRRSRGEGRAIPL
jgi:serine protease Do